MEEKEKNIDQGWKDAVEKEKEGLKEEGKFVPIEPDFNFFITTLSLQASIALGQLENPATRKKEEDLSQAKFLIDTLAMLKEKTKGNLSEEESRVLESILYELRMAYVSKIQGEKK
jgi:coproporphyrinogen III oxidase-like Fe-S oxidoreductase